MPRQSLSPALPEGADIDTLAPVIIDDAGVGPIITEQQSIVTALQHAYVPATIVNNDIACEYGATLTELKRERKRLDNQRLDLTKGLRETVDKINKLAAGPIEQLDKVIAAYEYQIVDWTKRERSRIDMEKQLREQEAEAERERLRLEAKRLQDEADRIRREAEAETARLRKIEDDRIAEERRVALARAEKLKNEQARENARIVAERNAENARLEAERVDAEAKAEAERQAQSTEAYAADTARIAETVEAKEVYEEPRAKGMSTPTTWYAEVTDFAALPDMFKMPDMAALNSLAAKQHERFSVPGAVAKSRLGVRSRI